MENVNCYINNGFPILATASRADLTDQSVDDELRYPLVHAVLRRKEIDGGESYVLYVEFEELVSVPPGHGLEYKCPHVKHVRDELIKYVHNMFPANKLLYMIDGELHMVTDTITKYTLLPANVNTRIS